MSRAPLFVVAAASLFAMSCGGATVPVYPPRPPETPGEAIADPAPARVVMHATITRAALLRSLEESVPKTGEGTFPLLGSERKYTWKRGPVSLKMSQGRLAIALHVDANADMPVSSIDLPLDFDVLAEPVVSSEYIAKLQSLEVNVKSDDRIVRAADAAADVLKKVKTAVTEKLDGFTYDLYPTLSESYMRMSIPVDIPIGEAKGCAALSVLGIEAGPTVLADGIEKDFALLVAPSVTIPCSPPEFNKKMPPLANVPTLPSGPFSVTIPIAAKYDELAKAMGVVFTDGKYYFSKEHPKLYMENPEIYASKDQLVLKVHIAGPVEKYGINTTLDGDLFLNGHPQVVDNELRIPDLEPTIETKDFLLKLKASVDGENIRDQARSALRIDIGERVKAVRDKLSTEISFANGDGCAKAQVHKVEITGVHVHSSYMRVYVTTTASASVYMPCP